MAERIFCAHADQDGRGAHWKFEGEECPTPCERCQRPFRRCSPRERLCDKCYFGYDPTAPFCDCDFDPSFTGGLCDTCGRPEAPEEAS